MRSPALRHVTHLRLTLVGSDPEIWREVSIDRSLPLAELHDVVLAAFDRPACRRHMFTDSQNSSWARSHRRWGDRWTMIDLRDPTVIDEFSAQIGSVMQTTRTLFHRHTCDSGWTVAIEAGVDEMIPSSHPSVRLVDGARRAPLPCSRDPHEHNLLVSLLDDDAHPDHDTARSAIDAAVGPWSRFEPAEFDLESTRHAIDERSTATRADHSLGWLVALLPSAAHPGLRAHLAATGLGLPSVVTSDDADLLTQEFRWLIERAAAPGLRITHGGVNQSVIDAVGRERGGDDARLMRVAAVARRYRLLYTRNGRLIAKKTAVTAARTPYALWKLLASEALSHPFAGTSRTAQTLFLLAIADGSLGDPAIGLGQAIRAEQSTRAREHAYRYSWGYDDGGDRRFGDDRCDGVCDCPDVPGLTWHEAVSRAVRRAAGFEADDGGVSPVFGVFPHETREGAPAEWMESLSPQRPTTTFATADDGDPEAIFLGMLGDFVELLSLFGLARTAGSEWIVPTGLSEFARAALQRGQVSRYGGY